MEYLRGHAGHTDYAGRLAAGRSIGSGRVEGACKQFVGKRMRHTGARWKARRADRMAGLLAVFHSEQWDVYWSLSA